MERHLAKVIPILIFLVSFSFTYAIEKFYDQHQVFDQYNTIFDADPNTYTTGFANGWGEVSFRHPFSQTIFALPVRATSKLIARLGGDEMKIRREVALLVVPLFEGGKGLILYLVLMNLGFNAIRAVVICGVNLFALCTITVGSVPESFPISSAMVVVFAWLMTRDFNPERRVPLWQWIVAGGFAAGITITNLIPLFVFFVLSRMRGRGESLWHSLRPSAVLAISSFILTFAVAASLCILFSCTPKMLLPSGIRGDLGSLGGDGSARALRGMDHPDRRPIEELTVAIVSTFAGVIKPIIIPNEHYLENAIPEDQRPKRDSRFAYSPHRLNNVLSVIWALVFIGMLLLGASRAYLQSPVWRSIALSSVALIIFNVVLHQFFYSRDMFLYSLHWQVPMVFLLAGLAFIENRKVYGFIPLSLLICGSVITGIQIIANVVRL